MPSATADRDMPRGQARANLAGPLSSDAQFRSEVHPRIYNTFTSKCELETRNDVDGMMLELQEALEQSTCTPEAVAIKKYRVKIRYGTSTTLPSLDSDTLTARELCSVVNI